MFLHVHIRACASVWNVHVDSVHAHAEEMTLKRTQSPITDVTTSHVYNLDVYKMHRRNGKCSLVLHSEVAKNSNARAMHLRSHQSSSRLYASVSRLNLSLVNHRAKALLVWSIELLFLFFFSTSLRATRYIHARVIVRNRGVPKLIRDAHEFGFLFDRVSPFGGDYSPESYNFSRWRDVCDIALAINSDAKTACATFVVKMIYDGPRRVTYTRWK